MPIRVCNRDAGYDMGLLASAPSNPLDGWTYINSADNTLYIYYGGTWQSLHVLTPATNVDITNEDGTTITNEDGTTVQREP